MPPFQLALPFLFKEVGFCAYLSYMRKVSETVLLNIKPFHFFCGYTQHFLIVFVLILYIEVPTEFTGKKNF